MGACGRGPNVMARRVRRASQKEDRQVVKPLRTKHCSTCDRCCVLLDHHCQWTGTCIGVHNQRFFFQYGSYTFLCLVVSLPRLAFMTACNWPRMRLGTDGRYDDWDLLVGILLGLFVL